MCDILSRYLHDISRSILVASGFLGRRGRLLLGVAVLRLDHRHLCGLRLLLLDFHTGGFSNCGHLSCEYFAQKWKLNVRWLKHVCGGGSEMRCFPTLPMEMRKLKTVTGGTRPESSSSNLLDRNLTVNIYFAQGFEALHFPTLVCPGQLSLELD